MLEHPLGVISLRCRALGFSLMEVMVSLALLGLIVGLVINIFPSSVIASRSADEQLEAENLAQSFLEEARASAFSSLIPGTTAMASPDAKYTVEREIFVPPGADSDQTIGVRIRLHWDSHHRRREIAREIWVSSVKS